MLSHFVEYDFCGVGAGLHVRVVADHEDGARIAFVPILVSIPNHTEVEEEDIVVLVPCVAFRWLLENLECVFAETHEDRMPRAGGGDHAQRGGRPALV
jgi:hypothetical protein